MSRERAYAPGSGETAPVGAAVEPSSVGGWRLERRCGGAQELHDAAASDPIDGRALLVQSVQRPALVIGSTQQAGDVDEVLLGESGIELARRRSGGGAVRLGADDRVWVDLVVPADDPLAEDDVERAAWWVGELWLRVLGLSDLAVEGRALVHRRGVSDRPAGAVACFAALGPGEIAVDGRKVLGVSQRRTRHGARFQCVAYRRWEPQQLLSLLSVDAAGSAAVGLIDAAAPIVATGWSVERDLLPALP